MDVKQPIQTGRQLQIRVDDKKAQEKWFSDAFKAVQQVGCRTIAKVWIKKIHPKKVRLSLELRVSPLTFKAIDSPLQWWLSPGPTGGSR